MDKPLVLHPANLPPDEQIIWKTACEQLTVPAFYVKHLIIKYRGERLEDNETLRPDSESGNSQRSSSNN
jgi:hypothetical protein